MTPRRRGSPGPRLQEEGEAAFTEAIHVKLISADLSNLYTDIRWAVAGRGEGAICA